MPCGAHMSATPICTAAGATRGCRSGAEEAEKESEAEQSDSIRTMRKEELRIGETNHGAERGKTSDSDATEPCQAPGHAEQSARGGRSTIQRARGMPTEIPLASEV